MLRHGVVLDPRVSLFSASVTERTVSSWDVNYSFSELHGFFVPLALLAPASRFQESQSKNMTLPQLSPRYALEGSNRL